MNKIIIIIFAFVSYTTYTQESLVLISGIIKDSKSNESLVAADVQIKNTNQGGTTDEKGNSPFKPQINFQKI